jgi:chromosome segregation ATPase
MSQCCQLPPLSQFYGFRKLRTDPILTSDVDPRTACYIRFYHDKFQKDRPELLHQIRRATKSDQQSKDDVESLKGEVSALKECVGQMSHRVSTLSTEYEKVTALLTELLTRQQQQQLQHSATPAPGATTTQQPPAPGNSVCGAPDLMQSLSQVAAASLQNHLRASETTSEAEAGVKRQIPEQEQQTSCSRQRTG